MSFFCSLHFCISHIFLYIDIDQTPNDRSLSNQLSTQPIYYFPTLNTHIQYTTFTHSIHTTNILLSHSQSIYHYYTLFTVNTHYKYTTFTHSITQPISYSCILLQNQPWRVSTRERERKQRAKL